MTPMLRPILNVSVSVVAICVCVCVYYMLYVYVLILVTIRDRVNRIGNETDETCTLYTLFWRELDTRRKAAEKRRKGEKEDPLRKKEKDVKIVPPWKKNFFTFTKKVFEKAEKSYLHLILILSSCPFPLHCSVPCFPISFLS